MNHVQMQSQNQKQHVNIAGCLWVSLVTHSAASLAAQQLYYMGFRQQLSRLNTSSHLRCAECLWGICATKDYQQSRCGPALQSI